MYNMNFAKIMINQNQNIYKTAPGYGYEYNKDKSLCNGTFFWYSDRRTAISYIPVGKDLFREPWFLYSHLPKDTMYLFDIIHKNNLQCLLGKTKEKEEADLIKFIINFCRLRDKKSLYANITCRKFFHNLLLDFTVIGKSSLSGSISERLLKIVSKYLPFNGLCISTPNSTFYYVSKHALKWDQYDPYDISLNSRNNLYSKNSLFQDTLMEEGERYQLYRKNQKPSISIDFDGVLHKSMIKVPLTQIYTPSSPDTENLIPNAEIFDIVRKKYNDGHRIIIVTARPVASLFSILKFLEKNKMEQYFSDIICTNNAPKSVFLYQNKAIEHYDDTLPVLKEIFDSYQGTLQDIGCDEMIAGLPRNPQIELFYVDIKNNYKIIKLLYKTRIQNGDNKKQRNNNLKK